MFCKYCGYELTDESVFCIKCGKKQVADAVKCDENIKKVDSKKYIILATVVLFAIVVGVIVWNLINKVGYSGDSNSSKNMETERIVEAETAENKEALKDGKDIVIEQGKEDYSLGSRIYMGVDKSKPIEWKVIANDGNNVLLLSMVMFDIGGIVDRYENSVRWDNSKLIEKLNNKFIEEHFDKEEIGKILSVSNSTDSNKEYGTSGGNDTEDKVFVLSAEEVQKYIPKKEDRQMEYEYDPNAYQPGEWILRTMGKSGDYICYVEPDGTINYEGSQTEKTCRPAMWIKIDSKSKSVEESNSNKNVEKKVQELQQQAKQLKIGDSISLGNWPQGDINTKDNIFWKVLEIKDDKALLISDMILDAQFYDSREERNPITWEISYARKWLNNDFYDEAFDAAEKEQICISKISTPDNEEEGTDGGNDTEDYLFLLSKPEIEHYLALEENRKGKITEYVRDKWSKAEGKGHESYDYATRTPGEIEGSVLITWKERRFTDITSNSQIVNLRPAMWINLEKAGYAVSNVDKSQLMAETAAQLIGEKTHSSGEGSLYAVYDFDCDGELELFLRPGEGYASFSNGSIVYDFEGNGWKEKETKYPNGNIDSLFWNPSQNTVVMQAINGTKVNLFVCDFAGKYATENCSFTAREESQKVNAAQNIFGNQLVQIDISSDITVEGIKNMIKKSSNVVIPHESEKSFSDIDVDKEIETIRNWYYNPGSQETSRTSPAGTNGMEYERQYYYHEGRLYFVFAFKTGEEHRFYFKDDMLIRYINNNGNTYDNEEAEKNAPEWMNILLDESKMLY